MRSGSETHLDSTLDLRRYEALLQLADVIVRHDTVQAVLRALADRLHTLAVFEFANFSLYDPTVNVMRLHAWQGNAQPEFPAEVGVQESSSGWVWEHQQALNIGDLREEQRFPRVLDILRARGFLSYCVVPLTTAQNRLGALGLANSQKNTYSNDDLVFLRRVAGLVAVAIENVQTREALHHEKTHLQALLEINQVLVTAPDLRLVFPAIIDALRRVAPVNYASLALLDPETQTMRVYVRNAPLEGLEEGLVLADSQSTPRQALAAKEVKLFTRSAADAISSPILKPLLEKGVQSGCCIPLITSNGVVGTLNLATTQQFDFGTSDIGLLREVANQIAAAVDRGRAYEQIASLQEKLKTENLYLQDEIRTELNFEEIVGESAVLQRVLQQAKTVAGSGATVLILGETGTGKELIARAIHRMSSRKNNSFIKLNCAAIPTGLLESELFGHERGAFTGAISQKTGRLELADKGTLFLDEVGDIPLELQPKLLRVLQDQEFERLGSTKTIRVDVRLVAATNRDLSKNVANGQFRSDLYYRLRVFPIHLPALRERKSDIPLLVRHFVQKFARRMDKRIETIAADAINALVQWHWPGNVRELENIIERSVILSEGPVLRVPLAELKVDETMEPGLRTLEQAERDHIVRVLKETRGLVSGTHGAAARLGLKRTTLQSKMRKLGISRREFQT